MLERKVTVFRADASLQIGSGHLMRCLTLADALRDKGHACHFICRLHPGHLLDLVVRRGHHVHALMLADPAANQDGSESGHAALPASHWLGGSQQEDARQTAAVLLSLQPGLLVVDHYALDIRWEQPLRELTQSLMVIDDLADRRHDCDLLLDHNGGRQNADYLPLVPHHCRILTGATYALLRPEFSSLREQSRARRRDPALRHLLISMGGVDQHNATGDVMEALRACPLPWDCRITVVMGSRAPWLAEVKACATTLEWPVEVKVDVGDMAALMLASDLAIGAAGSTSWERCCLGLPTLLLVLADNQQGAAQALARTGAAVVLDSGSGLHQQLQKEIGRLQHTPGLLNQISEQAAAITDGHGCHRVVEELGSLKIRNTKEEH